MPNETKDLTQADITAERKSKQKQLTHYLKAVRDLLRDKPDSHSKSTYKRILRFLNIKGPVPFEEYISLYYDIPRCDISISLSNINPFTEGPIIHNTLRMLATCYPRNTVTMPSARLLDPIKNKPIHKDRAIVLAGYYFDTSSFVDKNGELRTSSFKRLNVRTKKFPENNLEYQVITFSTQDEVIHFSWLDILHLVKKIGKNPKTLIGARDVVSHTAGNLTLRTTRWIVPMEKYRRWEQTEYLASQCFYWEQLDEYLDSINNDRPLVELVDLRWFKTLNDFRKGPILDFLRKNHWNTRKRLIRAIGEEDIGQAWDDINNLYEAQKTFSNWCSKEYTSLGKSSYEMLENLRKDYTINNVIDLASTYKRTSCNTLEDYALVISAALNVLDSNSICEEILAEKSSWSSEVRKELLALRPMVSSQARDEHIPVTQKQDQNRAKPPEGPTHKARQASHSSDGFFKSFLGGSKLPRSKNYSSGTRSNSSGSHPERPHKRHHSHRHRR